MISHQFPRSERLKSRKIITSLFTKGSTNNLSFNVFPVRFVWSSPEEKQESPIQAAFSVSKRTFKRANMRNTTKRRMKEAYRLHKHLLINALADKEKQYSFMFIFNGKEEMEYSQIEKSFKIGIQRFLNNLPKEKIEAKSE
jgi:ribonuclease P protein component